MTSTTERRLYVYAITNEREPPSLRGLGGAAVVKVSSGESAAFASWVEAGDLIPSEERLWEHEAVCEALMEGGPVIPARFGTSFSDEDEVVQTLRKREGRITSLLARLADHIELGIRVFGERPRGGTEVGSAAAAVHPGRAYLEQRRVENAERQATAAAIHRALEPLAREGRFRAIPAGHSVMAGAYLVRRQDVESFRRRVKSLEAEFPKAAIVCTGPWPPYSFVDRDLG
jgi:hypothetical protein